MIRIIRESPPTSGWPGRDRFDHRYADALLRHSARQNFGVDDDERRGSAGARALYRGGRGARRANGRTRRHNSERYSQGIHVRNTYIYPPEASLRITSDILPFARKYAQVQFDLDLRLSHAGGRRPADLELAYTLADGVEYIRAGIRAARYRSFAPRLSFFFASSMNFFMEVANSAPRASSGRSS